MTFSAVETAARTGLERLLLVFRKKIFFLAAFFTAGLLLVLGLKALAPRHGLTGSSYTDASWTDPPAHAAVDAILHFDKNAIAERTGFARASSFKWEGWLYAPKSSTYRFTVTLEGGAWVYVDDAPVIESAGAPPGGKQEKEIELVRGNHRLLIKFLPAGGQGSFDFRWRETKTPKSLMPRLYLYPTPASSGLFVFDTALRLLLPALQALFVAAGLLLLVTVLRAALREWELASILALAFFLVIAGAYEIDVFQKRARTVTGCDSYAYLQGALSMVRDGFFHTEYRDPLVPQIQGAYAVKPAKRQTIFLLSPHGYYVHDLGQGIVYNVFPPGMFLLLYPVVGLFGRSAAFLFLPVLGLVFLAAVFLRATKHAGLIFSMALCASLFFNEFVFGNLVRIFSDVPSLVLISAGAYFLYRNIERPRRLYPVLAGMAFGFAVMVRYSNAAGIVPFACLLGLRFRRERRFKELVLDVLAFFSAAFLFGFLPLAVYTSRLFGTPFRLVYEPYNQSRMQWASLGPGISFYVKALVQTFGPAGLALMGLGLIAGLARRSTRATGFVCALGFLSFFLFYAFNDLQEERYLLPAFPFLAVCFAFGVRALAQVFQRSFILKFLILAACVGYPFLYSRDRYFVGSFKDELISSQVRTAVETKSAVFCDETSGPLRFYAGLSAYRLAWTDGPTLKATLAFFVEREYAVYFLLDSRMATDFFQDMIRQNAISPEAVEPVPNATGFPLYRYKAALPSPLIP